MPTLGIDLQSGFDDDEVVVCVNGEERLRRAAVKSHRTLGLAERTTLEVEQGVVGVDVFVPGRHLEKHLDLDVRADTYVGLSLHENELRAIVRDEKFGYA